jgi:hypothetical protein
MTTTDGGASIDTTKDLGGGGYRPIAADSMLSVSEPNEAQEAADEPIFTPADVAKCFAVGAIVAVIVVGAGAVIFNH